MGCTYDVINIRLDSEKDAKNMVNLFNEIMKEDIYYNDLELTYDDIEDNAGYWISIDNEPLFIKYECGMQVQNLLVNFAQKYPKSNFYANYNCTFNNCGDCLYIEYNYQFGKLIVKEMYADDSGIYYCPECDEDYDNEFDEPLVSIENYEEGKTYICPNCGAEIEYNVDINIFEIDIKKIIDKK